jgi:hypothetical protein
MCCPSGDSHTRYIPAACHRTVSCARGSFGMPSRPCLVFLSPDWRPAARRKRRRVGWVSDYPSLSLLCVRHGTNAPRAKSVGGEKPDLFFEEEAIDADRNRNSPRPRLIIYVGRHGTARELGPRVPAYVLRLFLLLPLSCHLCTHLR